jgi:TPR repeat protein
MMRYSRLVVFGFLCWLIVNPASADACGWYGDGESDDDTIEVDSEEMPIPDEEVSIDDPEAQTRIGNRYKTGDGVPRNYMKQ